MSGWEWAAVAISIIGTWRNARMKIDGFYFWIVGNTVLMIVDFASGHLGQALMFTVYTGISIYGIWEWRRKAREMKHAVTRLEDAVRMHDMGEEW